MKIYERFLSISISILILCGIHFLFALYIEIFCWLTSLSMVLFIWLREKKNTSFSSLATWRFFLSFNSMNEFVQLLKKYCNSTKSWNPVTVRKQKKEYSIEINSSSSGKPLRKLSCAGFSAWNWMMYFRKKKKIDPLWRYWVTLISIWNGIWTTILSRYWSVKIKSRNRIFRLKWFFLSFILHDSDWARFFGHKIMAVLFFRLVSIVAATVTSFPFCEQIITMPQSVCYLWWHQNVKRPNKKHDKKNDRWHWIRVGSCIMEILLLASIKAFTLHISFFLMCCNCIGHVLVCWCSVR